MGGSAPVGHWITFVRWVTSRDASDWELPTGPMMYLAPLSRTLRATCGSWAPAPWSSKTLVSTWRPMIPPALLISSMAMPMPTNWGL